MAFFREATLQMQNGRGGAHHQPIPGLVKSARRACDLIQNGWVPKARWSTNADETVGRRATRRRTAQGTVMSTRSIRVINQL